jgi:hypothetical protein
MGSENPKFEIRNSKDLTREALAYFDLSAFPGSPASTTIYAFRISNFEFRV